MAGRPAAQRAESEPRPPGRVGSGGGRPAAPAQAPPRPLPLRAAACAHRLPLKPAQSAWSRLLLRPWSFQLLPINFVASSEAQGRRSRVRPTHGPVRVLRGEGRLQRDLESEPRAPGLAARLGLSFSCAVGGWYQCSLQVPQKLEGQGRPPRPQGLPLPGPGLRLPPGMRAPSTPSLGSPGIVGAPRALSAVTPTSPASNPPRAPSPSRPATASGKETRPQEAALGAGDPVGGRGAPAPCVPQRGSRVAPSRWPFPAALGLLDETLSCPQCPWGAGRRLSPLPRHEGC